MIRTDLVFPPVTALIMTSSGIHERTSGTKNPERYLLAISRRSEMYTSW